MALLSHFLSEQMNLCVASGRENASFERLFADDRTDDENFSMKEVVLRKTSAASNMQRKEEARGHNANYNAGYE